MTTNYHTPIVPGSAGTVASVNNPLGQLDTALSGILDGGLGYNLLNFIPGAAIVHNGSGSIAVTNSVHSVTQGTGSFVINNITGGQEGSLVTLVCNGVRFGSSGNIRYTAIGLYDPTARPVQLLFLNNVWNVLGDVNQFVQRGVVQGFPVFTSYMRQPVLARNEQIARPGGPADNMAASGVVLTNFGGTVTSSTLNRTVTTFTAGAANAIAGIRTTSNNITRASSAPRLTVLMFPSAINRLWVGFFNGTPGNTNVLTASDAFYGIRFAPAAGDTGLTLFGKNQSVAPVLQATNEPGSVGYYVIEVDPNNIRLETPNGVYTLPYSPTAGINLAWGIIAYASNNTLTMTIARAAMDSL